MGIVEVLTVIFVMCKIFEIGVIANWTWFQVFLPEIIALSIYAIMAIIVYVRVNL